MAGYVKKSRYLSAKPYKAACARGISQYNDPYLHLKMEMTNLGMKVHTEHEEILKKWQMTQQDNKKRAQSHEYQLKKHAAKWNVDYKQSDYIGSGNGWQQPSESESDNDIDNELIIDHGIDNEIFIDNDSEL